MRQLTILGGGSAYAPGLLQALIAHADALGLERVRLYDIDAGRLDLVARLGAGMARAAGAFAVEPAGTLEQAIEGADVVLNSTRPGGLAARRIDETLPLEFDIPGQETVGPGGFFYALRSVPEALRVAAAMERLAPQAVLLNYTNPSNIVSQALADQGKVRVIGMCDQSDEDLAALAHALGRSGPIGMRCAGLNHATWYSQITIGGAPLGALPERLAAPPDFDPEHRLRFEHAAALARAHPGYWPNSYLPYYLFQADFVALARATGPRSDVVAASLPHYYAHFAEEAARPVPQLRMYRGAAGFGDMAVRVMLALATGPARELVLNLPNRDACTAFGAATVVESTFRLGPDTLAPLAGATLPTATAVLLERLERYQRLAACAAAGGGIELCIAALATNPLVGDAALASRMLARARQAYGELIRWDA